jgi:DDE superfamily endonuclease
MGCHAGAGDRGRVRGKQATAWRYVAKAVRLLAARAPKLGPALQAAKKADHVITPYRGRDKPASQKDANRAHAKRRAPGERANAQLKTWHILRKLRSCPWRAGQLAKAIHILQAREIG